MSAEAPAGRPAGPTARGAGGRLLPRVVSAALFLPALWFVVRIGSGPYLALLFLIVVFGAREWEALLRRMDLSPWPWWMMLVAIGFFAAGLQDDPLRYLALLCFLLLAGLVIELFRRTGRTVLLLGGTILGGLYVGILPAVLYRIRALGGPEDPDLGRNATYLVFLTVWGCDTLAYTVGRAFGRRRFWPEVSPSKSWEGAIGGAVAAVVLAVLAQRWFAGFLGMRDAVIFGLLAGIISQVGDLAESLLKREAGVKDSSALIPGHGGVMDRFDSLLFTVPFLYAFLLLRGHGGGS